MDFEEQLEKAEKLPTPSLVGSSLRSADDSNHKNYIHPEKYKGGSKKSKKDKKNAALSNSTLGASLDDLMSEGALLGSEEDFTKFLDEEGHVKDDAKYSNDVKSPLSQEFKREDISEPTEKKQGGEDQQESAAASIPQVVTGETQYEEEDSEEEIDATPKPRKKASPRTSTASTGTSGAGGGSIYQNKDYSTPNLSEYQLENQINDHKDLLSSVQSYDHHRLPTGERREYNSGSASNAGYAARPKPRKTASFSTPSLISDENVEYDEQPVIPIKDGIHTPYFQRDGRSSSRSSSRQPPPDRSGSRSRSRPHLARGDSYKNTHDEDPSRYELPARLHEESEEIKEEPAAEVEEDDRRSRMSRPTMGDSIAAIEQAAQMKSSTSLLTTGDYTNFDVDTPEHSQDSKLFAGRSLSSTNYLRSISRSRSRQPTEKNSHGSKGVRTQSLLNEKNDADTGELEKEGALLSDDPYSTINGLDTMVEEVLHLKGENTSEQGKKKTPIEKSVEEKKTPIEVEEANTSTEGEVSNEIAKESDKTEEVEGSKEVKHNEEDVEIHEDKPEVAVEEPNSKEVRDAEEEAEAKEVKEPVATDPVEQLELKDSNDKADVSKIEESIKGLNLNDSEKNTDVNEPEKEEEVEPATKDIEVVDSEKSLGGLSEAKKGSATEEDIENEDEPVEPKDSEEIPTVEDAIENEPNAEDEQELKPAANKDAENDESVSEEVEPLTKRDEEDEPAAKEAEEDAPIATEDEEVEPVAKEAEEDAPAAKEAKEDDPVAKEAEEDAPIATEAEEVEPVAKEAEEDAPAAKVAEEVEPVSKESDDSAPVAKEVEPVAEVAPAAVAEAPGSDEEFDVSPEELRKHLEAQPVYIFTSLIGGMQVMSRTNRLSTILSGNQVKYTYRDLGTDEEAKKIWRRYANGKLLPGVVRGDDFIGNFQDIEDANEEYRVRELLYETL
ncbi:hypothetical protein CLIB1423_30S00474 [[Candida] railenensis]|uniref:Uncharacterized protein n=1 Tax=[Candida] railenensis TaxID=45579 RepID=A0A9P0QVA8_9ASCO|nr:hypothetical protein CLIB1423_30S00474 [[Candida] railenensis]